MVKFKIIACFNQKRALGNDGKLLYKIRNDLQNFRNQTLNNVVIMGRKTYESIGKPLEKRINIIITSNEDFSIDESDDVYIVKSIGDAIELCSAFFEDKELFVIGGESIYRQFMDTGLVDEMRLTVVNDDADGDVFFPNFDENDWDVYYCSMAQVSSYKNVDKSFYFKVLKKKENNG